MARRLLRTGVPAVILVGAFVALGSLPSGTSRGSLILRAAIGMAFGGVFFSIVRRSLRSLVEPPPAPLETVDARPADVSYVCAICGTRLRLEVAATGKPPRHCGEEMEARVG